MHWTRARRDAAVALALCLSVAVGWCAAWRLFQDQKLSEPLSYTSDAHLVAATVALVRRGDFLPFVSKTLPSLGAPTPASWNDFPMSEDVLFFVVGTLARITGTFTAINLGYVSACMLAALALFFVARRFGIRRDVAFMSGLLYGLSEFAFYRSVHHYSLLFYWVVPCQLLTAAYLGSRRGIPFRSKRFVFAAVTCVASAWSFAYLAIFAAESFFFGTVRSLMRERSRERLLPVVALAVLFVSAGVVVSLDTLNERRVNGPNPGAVYRTAVESELFSLEPIDFVAPSPDHRWPLFAALTGKIRGLHGISGEIPGPYLGLITVLFFAILLVMAFRALARRTVNSDVAWAATAGWFTAAHMVGGISSALGLFGIYFLRSTNRASIVVQAVVLLFAATWLSSVLRKRPAAVRWGVAVALALFGAYEQVPVVRTAEGVAADQRLSDSDGELIEVAEQALPNGTMVFELPPMQFPEAPPVYRVGGYDMFRPTYFATHLRFSHGDVKGRPKGEWKFGVASRPPAEMLAELKRAGFQAIYLNRSGFPDGGQALIFALVALGCHVLAEAPAKDSLVLTL